MKRIQKKPAKSKRSAISKMKRFEVFKRDLFSCQYCGATPPSVVLECDHIVPVASGGGNDIDNLVTACAPCNRGKAARSLNSIPQSLAEKSAMIQEAELQLAGYTAIMRAKKERVESEIWEVVEALLGKRECATSQYKSIKIFVERLGVFETVEAAEIARQNIPHAGSYQFKYFCAICWNKIKENKNG